MSQPGSVQYSSRSVTDAGFQIRGVWKETVELNHFQAGCYLVSARNVRPLILPDRVLSLLEFNINSLCIRATIASHHKSPD